MNYRKHKDITLSEIGLGCYALSGVYGRKDPGEFENMLYRAYELGVNFFDVAAGYGDAESILGKVVQPFRSEIHIATKVGAEDGLKPNLCAESIQKACERSLKRLRTDYIDLYQIHFDDAETPVEETIRALDNLTQAGKIRHYGVCHLPIERTSEYMRLGNVFSVLMELSAVTREAMKSFLPLCNRNDVAGIAFSTTGRGILTGQFSKETTFPANDLRSIDPLFQRDRFRSGLRVAKELKSIGQKYNKTPAQMALAWTLAHPGIVCALTGPSTTEHLKENLGGGGFAIPAGDLAEFQEFLDGDTDRLANEQRESVLSILHRPDSATSFVDLLYAIEAGCQLEMMSEEDGMSIVQELFVLREAQDEMVYQKMVESKHRLVEIIRGADVQCTGVQAVRLTS